MPRASAADAAETARRILETAASVFAADGVADASLNDIARLADVTRGAVYHHFGGKPGLVRAVVEHAQQGVAARIVATAESHTDPIEALRAGCHGFVDAVTEGDTARLLLVEAPAALGWTTWREIDAAAGARELREGIAAATSLSPTDVDAATQLLNGAMNDAALWLSERPRDTAARRAVHGMLDRLVDAVTGAHG